MPTVGEKGGKRRTESQMLLCVCCVPHKKLHEGDLRREQNWLGLVVWSAKKT